jgi:hypothetical protein
VNCSKSNKQEEQAKQQQIATTTIMAESDNEEYYAYSSDEDGYPLDDDNASMDWDGPAENPNAAPMDVIRREC